MFFTACVTGDARNELRADHSASLKSPNASTTAKPKWLNNTGKVGPAHGPHDVA